MSPDHTPFPSQGFSSSPTLPLSLMGLSVRQRLFGVALMLGLLWAPLLIVLS